MPFGPAEDDNHMQMLREARDQKCNSDLVIAIERKMLRTSIFPPIISQIRLNRHHAFGVCR